MLNQHNFSTPQYTHKIFISLSFLLVLRFLHQQCPGVLPLHKKANILQDLLQEQEQVISPFFLRKLRYQGMYTRNDNAKLYSLGKFVGNEPTCIVVLPEVQLPTPNVDKLKNPFIPLTLKKVNKYLFTKRGEKNKNNQLLNSQKTERLSDAYKKTDFKKNKSDDFPLIMDPPDGNAHIKNFVSGMEGNVRRRIEIKSCISRTTLSYIYKKYKISQLEHIREIIDTKKLKKVAGELVETGMFCKVLVKVSPLKDYEVVTFVLLPNPNIKYIGIAPKLLLLPQRKIESFFLQRFNYLRNIEDLFSSLNLLGMIYEEKGLNWNKIDIHNRGDNIYELIILEGLIDKVYLYLNSLGTQSLRHLTFIRDQLNLRYNSFLYSRRLEKGIELLRMLQMITTYQYKTFTNIADTNKQSIKIYGYQLKKGKASTYIFATRQISLDISKILQKYLGTSTIFIKKYLKELQKYLEYLKNENEERFFPELPSLYPSTNNLFKSSFDTKTILGKFLTARRSSILRKPKSCYGLRSFKYNFSAPGQYIYTKLSFPSPTPRFYIYSFQTQNNSNSPESLASWNISVFNSLTGIDQKNLVWKPGLSKFKNFTESFFLKQGIQWGFSGCIKPSIFLSWLLTFKNIWTNYFYTSYFPSKLYISKCQHTKHTESSILPLYKVEKIYKRVDQRVIMFDLQIHKKIGEHIISPTEGYEWDISVSNIIPTNNFLVKNILYKIQMYFEYYHTTSPFDGNTEIAYIKPKFVWLIGNENYVPFPESPPLSPRETIRGQRGIDPLFDYYYFKNSIEYHISNAREDSSTFFFIDYVRRLRDAYFYSVESSPIVTEKLEDARQKNQKDLISMGVGIQFYTKYRILPAIRIEYSLNPANQRCSYLSIFPKYDR
uniref:Bacterial surface antigen (D15) domain-containing protein n=1 Tax=Gronococcus sybilensis TaxID=3028029 RepID=A0A9Y1I2I7_9RHOD|nr:hypothetical protein GRSY_105 [Gronococcus sybilensis]